MIFLILIAVALFISSIGFKKMVWFISIGYGFSIAGIGLMLLIIYHKELTILTLLLSLLLMIYGCRLAGYIIIREKKSKSYQTVLKNDVKDGSDMSFISKFLIWTSCAFLYACQASPVLFRLENGFGDDICGIVGAVILVLGICLESYSDFVKNRYKQTNPTRYCDVSVFKIVRCPNYFGEILIWTGVFVSGITIYETVWQWIGAIFGYLCIVYIMFGGARRLELRHNKHYGEDPEYQAYVKKVPILIPLIPLHSVAKYTWLKG